MTRKTPVIGILGGIGSGKSTVAQVFAQQGCRVLDADRIAHRLLDTEEIKSQIIDNFGPAILTHENRIDRNRLAEAVFDSPEQRRWLERLIHPAVRREISRQIENARGDPDVRAVVLDVPLLVEAGWTDLCDHLVFVDASADRRRQRIQQAGKLSLEQWEKREKCQISLDSKRRLADTTVCNNSDFSALVQQVTRIITAVVELKD